MSHEAFIRNIVQAVGSTLSDQDIADLVDEGMGVIRSIIQEGTDNVAPVVRIRYSDGSGDVVMLGDMPSSGQDRHGLFYALGRKAVQIQPEHYPAAIVFHGECWVKSYVDESDNNLPPSQDLANRKEIAIVNLLTIDKRDAMIAHEIVRDVDQQIDLSPEAFMSCRPGDAGANKLKPFMLEAFFEGVIDEWSENPIRPEYAAVIKNMQITEQKIG